MSGTSLQPFGFTFEVNARCDRNTFKSDLRRMLKPWFDNRAGARGWVFGPLVCLWLSPGRMGPSLVALILPGRAGTQATGVAGFDLAGTLMLVAIGLGAPIFSVFMRAIPVQALLVSLVAVIAMMTRSGLHHDADQLVRFLEKVGSPSSKPKNRSKLASSDTSFDHLRLSFNGEDKPGPPTARGIETALGDMEDGDFLVISTAREAYMQVARVEDEFIIELREGSRRSHVRASYADGRQGHDSEAGATFPLEVTLKALLAYAEGKQLPAILGWRQVWPTKSGRI